MSNQTDETGDIVFTRGSVDALLFDVAREADNSQTSNQTKDTENNNRISDRLRVLERKSLSDTVKPSSSKSRRGLPLSSAKYLMSRTGTPSKSIHKIPFAKTEAEVVKDSSDKRFSRSAPSDTRIDQNQNTQNGISKESLKNSQTVVNQLPVLELVTPKVETKYSNIIKDIVTGMMVENVEVAEALSRSSISECKVSKSQLRTSTRSSKVSHCWDGHNQHIKSHSNIINRIPAEGLFRKSYTSVVDVNSQYNFINQGRNNKLKAMTWVHRMVIPDLEEEAEPITYDHACYFVKKKTLAHRPKFKYCKQPLKFGNTSFDSGDLQVQDIETFDSAKSKIELISNEPPCSKNNQVAFWELKNDVMPQKLFVNSVNYSSKKMDQSTPNDLVETLDQKLDFDALKVSLVKKTTVELKTKPNESFENYSKRPNLICVESRGWNQIQKLEIQVEDCDTCKSELVFDPNEKVKQHKSEPIFYTTESPSLAPSDTLKPLDNNDVLIAIGFDAFKTSNIVKSRPIAFSDAIEMIQFIVELNRRITKFQRLIRQKIPDFKSKNINKKFALTEQQSNIWKKYKDSVNVLRQRFPDQFAELEKSSRKIPLRSQFEKIII